MNKKICFIVSSPFTAKAFLLEHIKVLSTEFDVYLVANFENEEQKLISPFLVKVFDVKIERDITLIKDFRALMTLKAILKKESFDAIHSVTPKAGLIGMLAGKLAGTRVRIHIFTGQVWHTKTGFMKLLLSNIDKFIFSIATNILVDGQAQRLFLIENNIISEKDSRVLGKGSISGVDTNKFVPQKHIKERYRKELLYSNDSIVFVFLGRLNKDKGVLDLANAFAELQKEVENVKLLFIGTDETNLLPKIKEIIGEVNFKFYGSTNEPELILQAADVLCLPSYREGFGTSIIEGSLLELPIICSDTYGLKETIIDEETGLRHKVKDVESIYLQMKKLALNPNLRLKMGKAGREYVQDNFKASQISDKWLEYYKNILK
jgi:glycosyltransferase involved in cell wall biosynthesis